MPLSRIAAVTLGEPRFPAAQAAAALIARMFHWSALKRAAAAGLLGLRAETSPGISPPGWPRESWTRLSSYTAATPVERRSVARALTERPLTPANPAPS